MFNTSRVDPAERRRAPTRHPHSRLTHLGARLVPAPSSGATTGPHRAVPSRTDPNARTSPLSGAPDRMPAALSRLSLVSKRVDRWEGPVLVGPLGAGNLLQIVRRWLPWPRRDSPRLTDPRPGQTWDGGAATVVGDTDDRHDGDRTDGAEGTAEGSGDGGADGGGGE